jgi:hypothetical protein
MARPLIVGGDGQLHLLHHLARIGEHGLHEGAA